MPPLTQEAELALCQKARSGVPHEREAAFLQLFQDLRAPIFALCLHLTGRRSEAEDAVQECFLAVHRGLAFFRNDARIRTWVYRIAVRAALSVKARRKRQDHASLDEAASVASRDEDPESRAATSQAFRNLQLALGRLPEEHRIVLSLFAVDGLEHAEIAQILGIPAGTVWSRLHNARKRLATILPQER